jgi:hypothetical protein
VLPKPTFTRNYGVDGMAAVDNQHGVFTGCMPLWIIQLLSYDNGLLLRLSTTVSMEKTVQSAVRIRLILGVLVLLKRDRPIATRERGATGERRQPTTTPTVYSHCRVSINATGCLAWEEERSLDVQEEEGVQAGVGFE